MPIKPRTIVLWKHRFPANSDEPVTKKSWLAAQAVGVVVTALAIAVVNRPPVLASEMSQDAASAMLSSFLASLPQECPRDAITGFLIQDPTRPCEPRAFAAKTTSLVASPDPWSMHYNYVEISQTIIRFYDEAKIRGAESPEARQRFAQRQKQKINPQQQIPTGEDFVNVMSKLAGAINPDWGKSCYALAGNGSIKFAIPYTDGHAIGERGEMKLMLNGTLCAASDGIHAKFKVGLDGGFPQITESDLIGTGICVIHADGRPCTLVAPWYEIVIDPNSRLAPKYYRS